MKKINLFIALFVTAVLLSIGVLSQLSPISNIISKTTQVTPTISLEERDTCTTTFYDEVQDVIGTCTHYYNYTHCTNSSGPNTGCSLQQEIRNLECKTGQTTITKNTTECKPNEEMFVYLDYNFTTTGTFNVNATARNGTLSDSRNLTITIS